MKRFLKWTVGIAGTVIGLLVVAAVVLVMVVDPNDYKGKITEQVKQQTGRDLRIEGDIGLAFFPWLGLELGRMELGNAQGFGPEPFARIDKADVRVKILPLFSGAVEMDKIVLHGLALNLSRKADGLSNWDDLAGTGEAKAGDGADEQRGGPGERGPAKRGLAALAIGGIDIRDANLQWVDEMAGQTLSVRNFNLSSGAISLDQPFPVALSGVLSASSPAVVVELELETRLGLDLAQQQYRMEGTSLSLAASGEAVPGGKASLLLSGDLAADLARQTASAKGLHVETLGMTLDAEASGSNILDKPAASGELKLVLTDPSAIASVVSLPPEIKKEALSGSRVATVFSVDLGKAQSLSLAPLNLAALGLELKAQVKGERIIDQPRFYGELSSGEFVPRQLMANTGVALPEMADPAAMTKAKIASGFDAGLDHLALERLRLQLDDTTLSGSASVKRFKAPVIRYQLNVDAIDVDRYLPPPSANEKKQQKAPAGGGKAAAKPVALPLELLRSLDIDGTLKVGKVKVMNLRSDTIVTTLRAGKGLFRVRPLTANLYQGSYSGNLSFDVRKNTPVLGMDERLSGVSAGPLLKDFLGKDYVTGKANVMAKMSARGIEPMAIRKSLNGTGSFSFDNGQIKGVNIGQLIRNAYALYKKQPKPKEELKQTDFTALKGSFAVKNGRVTTRDLSARSPLFRVAGKGSAHLVTEKLDLRFDTTVVSDLKDAANQDIKELKGVTIPVTVKGSFGDPKFGVDVGSVLEAKLKAEANKRIEEEKKKLQKELEKKLKEMLKF